MKAFDAKTLKPSLDDTTLLTQKDVHIETIENVINKEKNDVMMGTAKKVLARFWRPIVTKDGES